MAAYNHALSVTFVHTLPVTSASPLSRNPPPRSTTVALVVAVVLLVLILVASLIVLYIKHRRIYSAYSQVRTLFSLGLYLDSASTSRAPLCSPNPKPPTTKPQPPTPIPQPPFVAAAEGGE
jgi:hypothetical protein